MWREATSWQLCPPLPGHPPSFGVTPGSHLLPDMHCVESPLSRKGRNGRKRSAQHGPRTVTSLGGVSAPLACVQISQHLPRVVVRSK